MNPIRFIAGLMMYLLKFNYWQIVQRKRVEEVRTFDGLPP